MRVSPEGGRATGVSEQRGAGPEKGEKCGKRSAIETFGREDGILSNAFELWPGSVGLESGP